MSTVLDGLVHELQADPRDSERRSCKLAVALFLVTVKVCIPPKLHKALK